MDWPMTLAVVTLATRLMVQMAKQDRQLAVPVVDWQFGPVLEEEKHWGLLGYLHRALADQLVGDLESVRESSCLQSPKVFPQGSRL